MKLQTYWYLISITISLYEHYAIIDKKMVWYGNMNLLSNIKEHDYMMRISNQQLIYELLQETKEIIKRKSTNEN